MRRFQWFHYLKYLPMVGKFIPLSKWPLRNLIGMTRQTCIWDLTRIIMQRNVFYRPFRKKEGMWVLSIHPRNKTQIRVRVRTAIMKMRHISTHRPKIVLLNLVPWFAKCAYSRDDLKLFVLCFFSVFIVLEWKHDLKVAWKKKPEQNPSCR